MSRSSDKLYTVLFVKFILVGSILRGPG